MLLNVHLVLGTEKPEEVSNSVQKPLDADGTAEKKQPAQKKKRKSNVEKSLEIVLQKFQESSNNYFLRFLAPSLVIFT